MAEVLAVNNWEVMPDKLTEAKKLFLANNLTDFLKLKSLLIELCQERGQKELSAEILEEMVGDYSTEQEDILRALPASDGFYLPHDEAGGGDFWFKGGLSSGVGQAALLDAAGHGAAALCRKEFALRFLELYQGENVFPALDEFLSDLPFMSQVDLLLAKVEEKEAGAELSFEVSGNPRLFIRDLTTGQVTYGLPAPLIKDLGERGEVIDFLAIQGYPPLSWGLVSGQDQRLNRLSLPAEADIFLSSDGLFDQQTVINSDIPHSFNSDFAIFCEEHRADSSGDFKAALEKVIKDKKEENGQDDDITVLILKVRNGRLHY